MHLMNSQPRFYLAPLRGVTDYIFRNTFEKYFGKFDYLLTPFIPTVKGSTVNIHHIRDILPNYNDVERVIPQIIGNDSADIITLANHLASIGYKSVNLNLGCPHPQITRKKRGSGMLPYPEMIRSILETVISKVKCTLSVKVRLGLTDKDDLERVIPVFNQLPLSEVIIHPRTGSQMYNDSVDIGYFIRYSNAIIHQVTYNGDLCSLDDFRSFSSMMPTINNWMIGRGVVSNPNLLNECRSDQYIKIDMKTLESFHNEIFVKNRERLSGPSHLLGKMKELWTYMAKSFNRSKQVLKKIQKKTSIEGYLKATQEIFNEEPANTATR